MFERGYNKIRFIILPIIAMTNLNKLSSSVERFEEQKNEKVLYIDEAQFRLVHTPKPTDTWKKLDEKFSKRKEVEKEKLQLKIEKQELVDQYDLLEKQLESVMSQPVHTIEEAEEKARKIGEIHEEMKKLRDKIEEKEKEIEKKDEEIEKLNVEINELADKVREEDHEANEIDKKRLDHLNQEKIKDLKSQL